MRAEATADNTSIRVSWNWQGVPKCANNVTVHYQPEGGSLMMYTVSNTTATNATLSNLQCDTEYTIWVYVRGGQTNTTSDPRLVSLPARGMYSIYVMYSQTYIIHTVLNAPLQPLPLPLRSLLSSQMPQVSG